MRNITPKQERKMKKRILIVTNHSYMFWQFRKELVEALQKEHEVILAMPFVGHEEDFRKMGIECIPVSMNRRGVNPFAEAKLLRDYKRLLQKISPDFVLTYSIKPNIYMGLLCSCKKIPYYANVQGLGTAFQKPFLKIKKTPANLANETSYRQIVRLFCPVRELTWKNTKWNLTRITAVSIFCISDES